MPHRDPIRMCVACRRRAAQGDLVRCGIDPSGHVAVGLRPRSGRGAYVCPRWRCLKRALRKGGVQRALGGNVGATEPQEILRQVRFALQDRLQRLAVSGGGAQEREQAQGLLTKLDELTAGSSGTRLTVDAVGHMGESVAPRPKGRPTRRPREGSWLR